MNKIAVITGASSGIGLLTAVELASRKYHVIATMRDISRRARLDEEAARNGVSARIEVRPLDITNFATVSGLVHSIVADHARIDVLVNNAGFVMAGFAEDIPLESLREQLDTNFFGHVNLTKAVLPTMRKQRTGHVIMVSSAAGRMGQVSLSSYSASKFALEGWSESLRMEMKSLGIRVVLVEPGAFATDIWDRNAKIPEMALSADSPNKERARRFAEFVKKEVVKRDAREVSRLIGGIADMDEPRLRYMIGNDAFGQLIARAILPWKMYEKLVLNKLGIDK